MSVRVFEEMIGSTIVSIDRLWNALTFHSGNGRSFKFYHEQECCESVYIEDIVGDMEDLLHYPLMVAEEVSNMDLPPHPKDVSPRRSHTWTFYRFGTGKGSVTVRWFGTSNGFYSERVNFSSGGKFQQVKCWQSYKALEFAFGGLKPLLIKCFLMALSDTPRDFATWIYPSLLIISIKASGAG